MLRELQLLGMTPNEAQVYWALVRFGPARAGKVIDELGLHRNIVYQTLDNLIFKGYATKVEVRGVWEFQISDPGALLASLRQREEIARAVITEISNRAQVSSRLFKVYEGKESYRRFWLESLERAPVNSVDYVAGAGVRDWQEIMGKSALEAYWALCAEKNFSWKQLYFEISTTEQELMARAPVRTESRVWDGKLAHPFNGNFNILHDTIILHTFNSPLRVIEIRDEALLPMFKNYFDIMWQQATPLELYQEMLESRR